jgi:hypothetical protein
MALDIVTWVVMGLVAILGGTAVASFFLIGAGERHDASRD